MAFTFDFAPTKTPEEVIRDAQRVDPIAASRSNQLPPPPPPPPPIKTDIGDSLQQTNYTQTYDPAGTGPQTGPTFVDPPKVEVGTPVTQAVTQPQSQFSGMSASDWVSTYMPWAAGLGLQDLVSQLIQTDSTAEEIVAQVRSSSQYKVQFPGMVDANGQRRFATERDYLNRVNDYRDVLMSFGMYDPANDTPMNYVAFFDRGIDPNELNQRLTTYKELERGTQSVKDAFYVYAGMNVTTDDLYQATVSPEYANQLTDEYDKQIAANPFDYQTFIERATQKGMEHTAELLQTMQRQGLVTGQVVSKLYSTDPNFARQVMAALGDTTTGGGETLNLDQLLATYEEAVLGSAAADAGLEMPTLERIQQLRAAGVQRANAAKAWGQYAGSRGLLQGISQRSNLASDVTQTQWENAMLLGDAATANTIQRMMNQETALGHPQGEFSMSLKGARITQTGRSRQGGNA